MLDQIKLLAKKILKSQKTVAFTGAGISTESGIPDFRGPKGIWKRYKPIELSQFLHDKTARAEYWRRKLEQYPLMKEAKPNKGHKALAKLYQKGFLHCIITQNIDGLHQNAGVPDEKVIELHGSNAYIACLNCRKRYEWEDVLPHFETREYREDKLCPKCSECGGWLKPATISFGQAMPEEETDRAFFEASGSDVLLAVGSSLSVFPAANIPLAVLDREGFLAIINNQPTQMDSLAHMVIQGKAGEILAELAEFIK
jgi:NAD-dependent deacetylase